MMNHDEARFFFSFRSTNVESFGNIKFKEDDLMNHLRLCCGLSHAFDRSGL